MLAEYFHASLGFRMVLAKRSAFVSSLVLLSNKPHQLNTFLLSSSLCSMTHKLMP